MFWRIYMLAVLLVVTDVVMKGSCAKKKSSIFAIDDIESMKDEINQIENNVNKIKDIVFNKNVIYKLMGLYTFYIHDTGNIIAGMQVDGKKWDDLDEDFKEVYAFNNIYPGCRVLSTNALFSMGKNVSDPTSLYFFTDISPKGYQKPHIVKKLCKKNGLQISIVFTGKKCTWSDKSWSVSDEMNDMYMRLAQLCSIGHSKSNNITEIVKRQLINAYQEMPSIDTSTLEKTVPPGVLENISFDVDSTETDHVVISVLGKNVDLSISPRDRQENIAQNANKKTVKLFSVRGGNHVATVKSESKTYVTIVSRSYFSFKFGLSELEPKSLNDTTHQAIHGKKIRLSVLIPNVQQNVKITEAQILGIDKAGISPKLPLKKISKDYYVTPQIVTPTEVFKVAVEGTVKAKGIIRRVETIDIVPLSTPPTISDKQIPNVMIVEGNETLAEYNSSLTLTCKVTACPKPKYIKWINSNGKPMDTRTGVVQYPCDYISYLDIPIALNDKYMCHAVNNVGTSTASITVKVKNVFTVVNPSMDVEVEFGKPSTLTCDVTSSLPMVVDWYHINEISGEKTKVDNSTVYTIRWNETGKKFKLCSCQKSEVYNVIFRWRIGKLFSYRMELTIKKMDLNLVGKYDCNAYLADNKAIKTKLSRRVKITGLVGSKVQIPANVTGAKGFTAVIVCNASGVPEPTIKWQFRGKSDSAFVTLGETGNVLRITNAGAAHEGQYKCVAENVLAKDEKISTLTIKELPRILSRRSIIHQAIEGDVNLKIPCVAKGDPKPFITWKVDGRPIAVRNSKFVVEDDGTLVIKYPKPMDTKSYVCIATNDAGSEIATFKAVIREDPKSPRIRKMAEDFGMSTNKKCRTTAKAQTTWTANKQGQKLNNHLNDVCDTDCEDKKRKEKPLQVCEKK